MARENDDLSRNEYGTKLQFEPNFQGPKGGRSCTDVICLLIFILFLGAWGFIGNYAYRNGDINRILVPTDSNGLKCGVDSQVINKPFLIFFDLQKCIDPTVPINGCPTPQVCVERCPTQRFVFEFTKCTTSNFQSFKTNLICTKDVITDAIHTCDDINKLVTTDKCAQWYLKSESLSRRCIPLHWSEDDLAAIKDFIGESKLTEAVNNIELLANIQGEGQKVLSDIVDTWKTIAISLIIAMLCCLIVIAMLRWLAAPLLWFSIIGVITLLSFVIYYSQNKYRYLVANPPLRPESGTNLQAIFNNYVHDKTTWLVLLIVASILLVILLLVVLVLRKRIQIAIALVKEGSKAVSTTCSTLFFPIVPWIAQIAVIVVAIFVLLLLISVGHQRYEVVGLTKDTNCKCTGPAEKYTEGSACDPILFHDNCHNPTSKQYWLTSLVDGSENPCISASCLLKEIVQPPIIPYFHAINVVGFFWVVFFISAFSQMVLAATFATWYWTLRKSDVPFFTLTRAIGRTMRYHLGTLAFGSLILTICRLIRVLLEYISTKLKTYDNSVTRAIMCCLKCFFWCLEKFLRFLNRNAYIMCAVHGSNFCSSAKDAFNLLMRNFLRVYALDKVTSFLFFLSKVLVTLGMGAITYFYLDSGLNQIQLNYLFVPSIIVMIGTYLISSVFFSVYSMAVDTLFLCFLEDCERNDGSEEKPYFMSKSLMKILGKKNDMTRGYYE